MSSRITSGALFAGLVGIVLATVATAGEVKPERIAGELTKIDGKALTITVKAENETKSTVITCTDATKLARDGAKEPVTLEDFKVGQQVRAYYNKADNTALAVMIANPGATPPKGDDRKITGVNGTLTKIDGKTLTIAAAGKEAKEVVVTCNDATRITRQSEKPGTPGTQLKLEDLKTGQFVRVYYSAIDNVAIGVIVLLKLPENKTAK